MLGDDTAVLADLDAVGIGMDLDRPAECGGGRTWARIDELLPWNFKSAIAGA